MTQVFFFFNSYFWLCWIFVAARGLSLVEASGGYSSLRCTGLSLRWLLLLRSMGSRRTGFSSCGSWALEHRFSSCGARAQLLHGTWDPPGPGLEPVSPALAGGVLTTAPPGRSHDSVFLHPWAVLSSGLSWLPHRFSSCSSRRMTVIFTLTFYQISNPSKKENSSLLAVLLHLQADT